MVPSDYSSASPKQLCSSVVRRMEYPPFLFGIYVQTYSLAMTCPDTTGRPRRISHALSSSSTLAPNMSPPLFEFVRQNSHSGAYCTLLSSGVGYIFYVVTSTRFPLLTPKRPRAKETKRAPRMKGSFEEPLNVDAFQKSSTWQRGSASTIYQPSSLRCIP